MDNMQEINRQTIEQYRANRHNPDSPFKNRPLILLTTIGAKSGKERTTPLMGLPDGDRLLVVASNNGAAKDPDWYRNVLANPEVTVEQGSEVYRATAHSAAGEEYQQLWDKLIAHVPFFAEHQAKVERQIPVVVLTRSEG